MDTSATQWFPDQGTDFPILISPLDMELFDQFMDGPIWAQSFSSESLEYNSSIVPLAASSDSNTYISSAKKIKAEVLGSCVSGQKPRRAPTASSSPSIISWGNPETIEEVPSILYSSMKPKEDAKVSSRGTKRSYDIRESSVAVSRPPSSNQDHILAERKRREKLSQQFISLSAIVPGLKKMDKSSVLGDAIKYMKELQQKVQALEEKSMKRTVESAVLVKKSQLASDGDSSSCSENSHGLPEIEVKLSEKTVMVRIHCENSKGVLAKVISEIESLHLTITNSSTMPFTSSSLDINIRAQMEEGFSMTVKEIVKNLNSAFRSFM